MVHHGLKLTQLCYLLCTKIFCYCTCSILQVLHYSHLTAMTRLDSELNECQLLFFSQILPDKIRNYNPNTSICGIYSSFLCHVMENNSSTESNLVYSIFSWSSRKDQKCNLQHTHTLICYNLVFLRGTALKLNQGTSVVKKKYYKEKKYCLELNSGKKKCYYTVLQSKNIIWTALALFFDPHVWLLSELILSPFFFVYVLHLYFHSTCALVADLFIMIVNHWLILLPID